MIRRFPFGFLIFLIAVAFSGGCSIDYGAALTDDDISNTTPNTIIEDLTFISVSQGKPVMEISADRALAFDQKKETHLEGVSFHEFDTQGNITAEGSGDSGVYFQETEDVEMEGNLNLYSKTEDSGITADHLYWTKETKELAGRKDSLVRISREDGSYIQGYEFRGQLQQKIFTFETQSTGMLVVDDDADEENPKDGEHAE